LVGDIAEWILGNMKRKQPTYAVAAALTTVSMFSENTHVVAETVTSLNLYTVLLGDTTAGKEGPRHNMRLLFKSGGMFNHMREQVASGAAILRDLHHLTDTEQQPSLLMTFDEMGKMLQGTAKNSHLADAVSELTRLWGMATSGHSGKSYADQRAAIEPIQRPFVGLFGTTTEGTLVAALNSGNVSDGWLGRLLFVTTEDQCPPMDPFNCPAEEPPESITSSLKQLRYQEVATLRAAYQMNTGEEPPAQLPILLTAAAKDVLKQFLAETEEHANLEEVGPLWGRGFEQAVRIGGILALGTHGTHKPTLDEEHARWAVDYVRTCIESASALVEHNIADNDDEKDAKTVLRILRKMSPPSKNGRDFEEYRQRGLMPRSILLHRFKKSSKRLDEVLQTLAESEQIVQYAEKAKTGQDVVLYGLDH
jgi:hypothetical protein